MATRRAGSAGRQADSASAQRDSEDHVPSPYLNTGQTARNIPPQQQQLSTLALVLFTAWLVPILLGTFLFEEVQTHAQLRQAKVSLPLDWFDWLLRHWGTLLPAPAILLRLSDSLDSLLPTNPGGRLELAAYLVASATRLCIYQLHVKGVFGWLTSRGALAAVPVQYMSDHIFLSGCITAILATEIVIGIQQVQRSSQALLLPATGWWSPNFGMTHTQSAIQTTHMLSDGSPPELTDQLTMTRQLCADTWALCRHRMLHHSLCVVVRRHVLYCTSFPCTAGKSASCSLCSNLLQVAPVSVLLSLRLDRQDRALSALL